jgi:uncharacterized protein YvpB
MYTIKVKQDTFLKKSTAQSNVLELGQKALVIKDRVLCCNKLAKIENHLLLNLVEPVNGSKEWYVYTDHIDVKEEATYVQINAAGEKQLKVRYFSQRDNIHDPSRTCNVTSVAMALDYYGIRPKKLGEQLEDELYKLMFDKSMNILLHLDLVKVMNIYGVESKFSTLTPYQEIRKSIDKGNPVIFSGRFTPSGHIVVIVGYSDVHSEWIVNDPWGDWNSKYNNRNGSNVRYKFEDLIRISDNTNKGAWAHLISSKKTSAGFI